MLECVDFARAAPVFTQIWAALAILAASLWYWWKKPNPRFPPGPRGIPFLGALPFLGRYPYKTIKKLTSKFGPIMGVRMGGKDVVVLNSYETLKLAFVEQASVFSDRANLNLFQQNSKRNGIILKQYGDLYRSQKQFALKTFKNIGLGTGGIRSICEVEANYFVDYLKSQNGKSVDLTVDYYNLASNVISKIVLGRRFEYNVASKGIFAEIHQLFSDPNDSMMIMMLLLFEKLRFIPPFYGANKRFYKRQLKIQAMLREVIEEHKVTFDPNDIRDFIDAFIHEQRFSQKNEFTDRQLQFFVRDLFLAGSETTSNSMSWLFLFLLHHPDYKKLILKEIDDKMGSDGPPPTRAADMPMTCAFMQEVSRYSPISPLGVQRQTSSSTYLGGYFIPAETQVLSNIWAIHRDAEIWPDPNTFNPRRHIDAEGRFVFSNRVIPFSMGSRMCLGENIARVEKFVFFTKILQKFDFSLATDKLPSLDNGFVAFTFIPDPHKVLISER